MRMTNITRIATTPALPPPPFPLSAIFSPFERYDSRCLENTWLNAGTDLLSLFCRNSATHERTAWDQRFESRNRRVLDRVSERSRCAFGIILNGFFIPSFAFRANSSSSGGQSVCREKIVGYAQEHLAGCLGMVRGLLLDRTPR